MGQDTKVNAGSESPACLSEEWIGYFNIDTEGMSPGMRERMKMFLRMAYSRGRVDGFFAGLDKAADIANGSPKARYSTEEVAASRTADAERAGAGIETDIDTLRAQREWADYSSQTSAQLDNP